MPSTFRHKQVRDLSSEQRATRPLDEKETISAQAFELASVPEQQRRQVSKELRRLFAEVDQNLRPATAAEAEEIFSEAARSTRSAYRKSPLKIALGLNDRLASR